MRFGPGGFIRPSNPENPIERALSFERFARYRDWAGGDPERALELYALNMRLSEALYTPLQILEVALRNRIHTVLAQAYSLRWFEDERVVTNTLQQMQVSAAVADLVKAAKDSTPGRVVAALTFGFWTAMLGAAYEDLWQMHLHRIGFRAGERGLRRKDLSRALTPIRLLRNRIAHHEPILSWDLRKHHEAMAKITAWLANDLATWADMLDRFDQVYPTERIALQGPALPD